MRLIFPLQVISQKAKPTNKKIGKYPLCSAYSPYGFSKHLFFAMSFSYVVIGHSCAGRRAVELELPYSPSLVEVKAIERIEEIANIAFHPMNSRQQSLI